MCRKIRITFFIDYYVLILGQNSHIGSHSKCLMCAAHIASPQISPVFTALLEPFLERQIYLFELSFSYLSISIFKYFGILVLRKPRKIRKYFTQFLLNTFHFLRLALSYNASIHKVIIILKIRRGTKVPHEPYLIRHVRRIFNYWGNS